MCDPFCKHPALLSKAILTLVDDRTFSCRSQCGKAGTVPVLVLLLGPGRFGSISWVLQVFAVLNPYSKWPYDCDLATGNKKCKAR